MPFILQFDFPSQGPFGAEMVEAYKPLAESIAKEEGLIWKIWNENAESKEVGGIYLFDTADNAEKYRKMHTARLEGLGITNIRGKMFKINQPLSEITGFKM